MANPQMAIGCSIHRLDLTGRDQELCHMLTNYHLSDQPHGQEQQSQKEAVVLEVDMIHQKQTGVEQDQRAHAGCARHP